MNNQYKEIILNVKKTKYIIIIIKVAIICFFSFYLLGNPYPFYLLNDAMVYAISSEHLANGMYGFSNELMQRFNGGPFTPHQWVGTVHDTAIPITQIGVVLIGAISYFIGGYTGLLLVGPLFAILLFIVSERIASKLFGPISGLVTLILVVSSNVILWNGRGPHNDLMFSLFVVLGFFYLVKFFHEYKNKQILLASVFFLVSAVFRISGVIIFPIELFSFFLIFIYHIYFTKISKFHNEIENHSNTDFQAKNFMNSNIFLTRIFSKQNQKIIKWSILMIIPWLIFFTFFMIFNYYYFGDPFTTYIQEYRSQKSEKLLTSMAERNYVSSILIFDSDRIDWIKYFTIGLIPDNLNLYLRNSLQIYNIHFTDYNVRDRLQIYDIHFVENNWISIIVYLTFLFSLLIAYFKKFMRLEVFLIIILVIGFLLFQSTAAINPPYTDALERSGDVQFRYMIPSYVLFAMLVGFITQWVIQSKNFKIVTIKNTNLNFFKRAFFIIGFFIVLSFFLVSAIYDSFAIEHLLEPKTEYFVYPDVEKVLKLTRDEFPENGIIITQKSRLAITLWDGVPFFTSTGWHDGKLDVNKINQEDIKIITTLMNENYEFFAIESKTKKEAFFFRYLEQEYDLILKNSSTNLCKLEQVSSESKINQNSDDICYGRGFKFVEKFQ